MLEKLTCCLAHPMTALRTLRDKINDVITAHNELVNKVDNLPAGGGGSEPSQPSAGGVFLVRAVEVLGPGETPDAVFSMVVSLDKTYEEITQAMDGGLYPYMYVPAHVMDGLAFNLPCVLNDGVQVLFGTFYAGLNWNAEVFAGGECHLNAIPNQ